jgi:hypothetical protein
VVVLALAVTACGDGGEDPGDEESFCRLAAESDGPLAEADAETMALLAELAPPEVRDQVAVMRELADEVDGLGQRDPDRLAVEFEVRFSDRYIEARSTVEQYERTECDDAVGSVRTTATTQRSGATSTSVATSDETEGDDG